MMKQFKMLSPKKMEIWWRIILYNFSKYMQEMMHLLSIHFLQEYVMEVTKLMIKVNYHRLFYHYESNLIKSSQFTLAFRELVGYIWMESWRWQNRRLILMRNHSHMNFLLRCMNLLLRCMNLLLRWRNGKICDQSD